MEKRRLNVEISELQFLGMAKAAIYPMAGLLRDRKKLISNVTEKPEMLRIMGFVLLFSKKWIYLERNREGECCHGIFFTFIINKKFPPGSKKSMQPFYCYFLFTDMGDLLSYFYLCLLDASECLLAPPLSIHATILHRRSTNTEVP